ncbi:hypothetical protein ACL02S_23195 [Nocardia sp. 004]|uniref:hypothetical protein n=1 Tax=Nocardia sp. 004 TaxID=3385978 RepID=UPI0039A248E4
MGLLEAVNLVTFVIALRLGPLPVVVALHLTAPVLLIVAKVVAGRRKVGTVLITELVLVIAAIVLIAIGNADSAGGARIAIACVLALVSAGCVAALISMVAAHSGGRDPIASAGLQLATAALLGLPLLGMTLPSAAEAAQLAVIGAGLLGPGFACYWWALQVVDAPTAGIIGLNEAVAASVIGTVIGVAHLTVTTVTATILILTAVALEQRHRRARSFTQNVAVLDCGQ